MAVINTNVKSLIAADSLRAGNASLAQAMERLSTGKKINSAKDDAAGLAISSRMTSQVRGLSMAIKNANDGISLAQTAEGAMTEVTDMLQRMRELAVEAGNTTNSALDRSAMNDEIKQLKSEVDRIAKTTQFNGMNILDGSFKGKLQIGNNVGQTMDLAVSAMDTTAMGETVDGVATAATKASLSLGGVATSAAAYSGVAFNATVNGVTKNIVLPTATPANPAVSASIIAPDLSVKLVPDQIGAFKERTISVVTNATMRISVNDGDTGTQVIDIKTAATNLGYDTAALTGDQFVKSFQTAIDSSTYFTGDNKVTVGLDANDNLTMSVAGGAKKIAVTEGATGGLLAALATGTTGAGQAVTKVAAGAPLSFKAINLADTAAAQDAAEIFGMKKFGIADTVNDTLTIKSGAGQAVSLDLVSTATYFDNMSDVATFVQSAINTSGNFTGENAVNVAAVKNSSGAWGLTFSSPAGKSLQLSGNFMTALSGLAGTVNNTATDPVTPTLAFLQAGTTSITVNPNKIFGASSAKTVDLSSVMASDGTTAIATGMQKMKMNVNGGGDVLIDMSTVLTNMVAADASVDTSKLTQAQFVSALQTTINNTGLFAGVNKVTVGVNDKGMVTLAVAGGVGSIIVKEDSDPGAVTTKYDGLVKLLTGSNGGVIGNAMESVTSGGQLTLGASYNNNITSAAAKPAGQLTLINATANTVVSGVVAWKLTDSLGNVTSFASATTGATTNASLVTAVTNALRGLPATGGAATAFSDTGNVASLYEVSSVVAVGTTADSGILIKRKDGVDFTLQRIATDAQNVFTPDSTSAVTLGLLQAPVSSSQLVNPFSVGPTVVGAGDGGSYETNKSVLSGATVAGDKLTYGTFTYTVKPSDIDVGGNATAGTFNKVIDAFANEYNSNVHAEYVASRGADAQLVMTAKNKGNVTDVALVVAQVGAGSAIATANTATNGTATTYNLENTLTLKIGNSAAIDVKVSANDYEYTTLDQLKTKVQSAIDSTVGLEGTNRVVVGIATDSITGKSGLTFTQSSNKELSISGNFVTKELKANNSTLIQNVSGGVDLSSNNQLSVSIADVNSGQTVTKNITLASTSKNVSLADYASLVQTGINTAFATSGSSVTSSIGAGKFNLSLDQAGAKTITVTGASLNSVVGVPTVTASGVAANSLSTMTDVVREIQADLGDVATVAYDAAKGQMTFAATNGTAGTNNTISLSGAGLAAIQFGGALAATGSAGNATASKLSDVNVLTTDAATSALGSIDNSIEYVSKQRSLLGAIENRLLHTVNNLTNIVTNTEASRSAILDTDYSKETTALAKNQIITQAATAMLAQANQSSQTVLSLLK